MRSKAVTVIEVSVGKTLLVEYNRYSPLIGTGFLVRALISRDRSFATAIVASPRHFVKRNRLGAFIASAFFRLGLLQDSRLYISFGVRSFLPPTWTQQTKREADEIVGSFFASHPTKTDFERWKIHGILVGDLFYDTFLRQQVLPTLDLALPQLRDFCRVAVADFLFWWGYMSPEKISCVVASHGVYSLAIPLRIAVASAIPAFVVTEHAIYRLSPDRLNSDLEFLDYPEVHEKEGLAKTPGHRIAAHQATAPAAVRKGFSIRDSHALGTGPHDPTSSQSKTGVKVLVALHAFSDSPHWGADNLFPDYFEWLHFLGEMSDSLPYEWVLKLHPEDQRQTLKIAQDLVRRYPRFSLMQGDGYASSLPRDEFSACFTCHGTVGRELPLLGVPVVNAARRNPHIRYSFNHHPQSLDELASIARLVPSLPKPGKHEHSQLESFLVTQQAHSGKSLFLDGWPPSPPVYSKREQRQQIRAIRAWFFSRTDLQQTRVFEAKIEKFLSSEDYMLR